MNLNCVIEHQLVSCSEITLAQTMEHKLKTVKIATAEIKVEPDLRENKHTTFFKIYFNLGYFLLTTPFKFKSTNLKSNGLLLGVEYNLHTNCMQQSIWFVAQVLLIFQYFSESRRTSFANLRKNSNPEVYFQLFDDVATIVYKFVFAQILWKRMGIFLNIMRHLEKHKDLPVFQYKTWLNSPLFISILLGLTVLSAVVSMIFSYNVVEFDGDRSTEWILRRYVGAARYNFFLTSNSSRYWAPKMEDISKIDCVLGIINFFGICVRQLISLYSDGCLLIVAMLMWVVSKGFKDLVRTQLTKWEIPGLFKPGHELQSSPVNIMRNYRALKKLSSLLNSALDKVVLIYVAEYLFYYSVKFDAMFTAEDKLWKTRNSIFFAFIFFTFFFAGDSCKNVEDSLSAWISSQTQTDLEIGSSSRSQIDSKHTNVLLHEAKSHVFGLSGHIFVLDYNAIFNFVATMVTYFVVCSTSASEKSPRK